MARSSAIAGAARIALAVACAACGNEPGPAQAPPAVDAPGQLLVAAPGDRQPVAEVNGVPIYDDCVARQGAALGVDVHTALQHCIDFELLAQQAQRRGMDRLPEVAEVRRTEAVRRLLDEAFAARFPDPEGTDPRLLQAAYERFHSRYNRPEVRKTYFARARAKDVAEGSPEDRAARALAREIYRALAGKRDITMEMFSATATEIAGDRAVEFGQFEGPRHRAVPAYADAAFGLPAAGMVARPVRTRWGWDVILVVRITGATHVAVDQEPARTELFQYVRRKSYVAFTRALTDRASVAIDDQALAAIQAAEEASQFASEQPR